MTTTLYEVEFERPTDQTRVTGFADPQGATNDMHELNGILAGLPIPEVLLL